MFGDFSSPVTNPLRSCAQGKLPREFGQQEQTEQQGQFIAFALPSPGIGEVLQRFIQRASWDKVALNRLVDDDQGGASMLYSPYRVFLEVWFFVFYKEYSSFSPCWVLMAPLSSLLIDQLLRMGKP